MYLMKLLQQLLPPTPSLGLHEHTAVGMHGSEDQNISMAAHSHALCS